MSYVQKLELVSIFNVKNPFSALVMLCNMKNDAIKAKTGMVNLKSVFIYTTHIKIKTYDRKTDNTLPIIYIMDYGYILVALNL